MCCGNQDIVEISSLYGSPNRGKDSIVLYTPYTCAKPLQSIDFTISVILAVMVIGQGGGGTLVVIAPLAAVVTMTQGVTQTQARGAASAEENTPERGGEDTSTPKRQRRDNDARIMMVSWISAIALRSCGN